MRENSVPDQSRSFNASHGRSTGVARLAAIVTTIGLTVGLFGFLNCPATCGVPSQGEAVLREGLMTASILMDLVVAVRLRVPVDVKVRHLRFSKNIGWSGVVCTNPLPSTGDPAGTRWRASSKESSRAKSRVPEHDVSTTRRSVLADPLSRVRPQRLPGRVGLGRRDVRT